MFGSRLRLDIRGASHASAIRFSLAGFPKGFRLDERKLAAFMERRAPGRDSLSTQRREPDRVVFTNGIEKSVTTGDVIRGEIRNVDARPGDYGRGRTVPRPGHADFGQWVETGVIPTGGGKNSGRLTAAVCAAGGICRQFLAARGIDVAATIESIHGETDAKKQTRAIEQARDAGDSVGGWITCVATGLPPGLGGALADGLECGISAALFAIPGVKAVSFGDGLAAPEMLGSEFNDEFMIGGRGATRPTNVAMPESGGRVGSPLPPALPCIVTRTNRQGGILGGRTDGMPVVVHVALRPTPTLYREQRSVDLATMTPATLAMKGRHDPCIVRRAVPVVEASVALALADAILADEARRPRICLTLTGATIEEDLAQYASQRYFTDMVELRIDLLKKPERAKAKGFATLLPKDVPVIYTKDIDHTVVSDGRLINPVHDFKKPVKNLAAKCRALSGKKGVIAKVACQPKSMADVARLFKETENLVDVPHVTLAMGAQGLATRVLAARTRSLWTYCSVGGLESIGHISPEELVRTYRFRSITRDATLFGVTGWPLKKTRSPELHNAAFADEDLDAVMIPFPAKTAREALDFMKAMGMKGLAVTIPHKQTIMPLLDRIDASAKKIGAVNTVSFENGKYVGYNTDLAGFSEALVAFAGKVRGKRVAVLGDGGAAQAVKAALKNLGAKFEVFHRQTPPKGFDILVNATPVDPIPDYEFSGKELVYDLGYVPETTPLLARAAAAGCRVENGFTMLKAQAREQRRIWLDQDFRR